MANLVARGFGLNGKSTYTNVTTPQDINLQFAVTPTNGLGVTSVKSNGYVRNVFMHTSTTPAANNGYTNPNPANGYLAIQFYNNFQYYLNGIAQFVPPVTGSALKIDNAEMTAGIVYVITTLGTATAANWRSVGVPPGITAAVGVSFVALSTGIAGNTLSSRVKAVASSNVYGVEVVGTPNTMSKSSIISANGGAWLFLQFLAPTFTAGAYTPAGTISAPIFTGSALGNHSHDLFLKNAAVSDGATTAVNAGTNLLGANTGSDITVAGGAATNGGIVNASAGTPAGTNSVPIFTGSAGSLSGTLALGVVAPTTGTVVNMRFSYDASSVTIDGI